MKQLQFPCKIQNFRKVKRFTASKVEVMSKLKKEVDMKEVMSLIQKLTKDSIATYDVRTVINTALSALYRAKQFMDKNSQDDYKFIETPLSDLNIYFIESE